MDNKIAILFMSNRFSQKLSKRLKIVTNNIQYETEPINMRKITNYSTIKNKLSKYEYVFVYQQDIDIIEKLDYLRIKYTTIDKPMTKQIRGYLYDRLKQTKPIYYLDSDFNVISKQVDGSVNIEGTMYSLTEEGAIHNEIDYWKRAYGHWKSTKEQAESHIKQISDNLAVIIEKYSDKYKLD